MYKIINFIERGIKIFMYNNIPVFINPLLILMFLFIDFGNSYDIITDAILMVSIFTALLVHELGHLLMSKNTNRVYLTFFNKIETDSLLVAIGGVIFNLTFSILLYGLLRLVNYYNIDNPILDLILISNISINLLLGLFNSLPIIPLDGIVALKVGISNKYVIYSISILTSILMILFSIYIGNIYMIIFSMLFSGYSISEFYV